MPSSLIFAGLVVLWLLILVPAVARHQQEVARPTFAALSGRVLQRPTRQRRTERVDGMDDTDGVATTTIRDAEFDDAETAHGVARRDDEHDDDDRARSDDGRGQVGDRRWERPAPGYRPGRGGFDPEAAALTARARYAFRQRVVLLLLVSAVATAVLAAIAAPGLWWLHVVVDGILIGYLGYLRRQVRLEEAIRERRAARMAGTRRPAAAEDPDLDDWARRGRLAAQPDPDVDDDNDDLAEPRPENDDGVERICGTGEPVCPGEIIADDRPALPRLTPAPPPPLPSGTTVVGEELDDDLDDLDAPHPPDYRRAVGQ